MPQIFKPKGKDKFVVFYTDHTGQRRKKTLTADRETSERIARDLLNKVALRKDGVIDQRDERLAEQEGKPLKDHLDDYARLVSSKGATKQHVNGLVMKIKRILDLGKMRRISDVSLSRVQEAIGQIRQERSTGTVNTYIQRMKSFARWLWRDKRAREYVLDDLRQTDAKNDRRHVRRRLTDEEVIAIVNVAEHGRTTLSGFSGPDRAMLYRLAHGTGFRAKELRTLAPEQFHLGDDPPTVNVLACYSKNRQEAIQPIAAALADLLSPWLARKRPGKPVFEGMPKLTAEMLRQDLKVAGIPYKTDEGVADFHSSRGTYISNLVSSGASVKTCQILARHADPALTIGIYAKASLHDISGAVEALPDLTATGPERQAMKATGTDERPGATRGATLAAEYDQTESHNISSGETLRVVEANDFNVRDRQSDPCRGRRE